MTIVLPALAVAFGAFFVWLTVFVINRREYWATWRRVLVRSFMRTLPWGATLAVVVVGVLWFVVEPKYYCARAKAYISGSGFPPRAVYNITTRFPDRFVETELEWLQSPLVIRQAIESDRLERFPELQSRSAARDPVPWISRYLTVEPVGTTFLYDVSYTARDPESASKIVNAVLNSYMSRFEDDGIQGEFILEELARQLLRLDEKIESQRDRLNELTPRLGVGAIIETNTHPDAESWGATWGLRTKLALAEVEVEIGRARIAGLHEAVRRDGTRQRKLAIQFAEDNLTKVQKNVEKLAEKLAAEQSEHGDPPEPSVELEWTRLELRSAVEIRNRIADCIRELTAEWRSTAALHIVQLAATSASPDGPTPGQLMAIAGTVALFTPFLLDVLCTAISQVRSARRRREAA
jgi:hypothetical protein